MVGIEKQHINIVVLGHISSGKSTTCGHLLMNIEAKQKNTNANEYMQGGYIQQLSHDTGKSTYKFAWIMDRFAKEREIGMSIDVSKASLETPKYNITLIDVPGHINFIKNMVSGTSQGDVAILMISASKGEYEAGFLPVEKDFGGGQSREHAIIAYALGIKQLIVCVNKMDEISVNYSQDRFQEIQKKTNEFLLEVGFKHEDIQYIPLSGWLGENLSNFNKDNEKFSWYKGKCLLEAFDDLKVPERVSSNKPLRIVISNVYKIAGIGTVPIGVVRSGTLKPGSLIEFVPSGIISECKSIEMNHIVYLCAEPGHIIGFNVRGVSSRELKRGFVAGDNKNQPPVEAVSFQAQIIILNHPTEIRDGYQPIIHIHSANVACSLEIIKKIDQPTQNQKEENLLKKGDSALVKFTPIKPIVVETFEEHPSIGRFIIRDSNLLIGVGIVKSVIHKSLPKKTNP